jgi:hypothetical protein
MELTSEMMSSVIAKDLQRSAPDLAGLYGRAITPWK